MNDSGHDTSPFSVWFCCENRFLSYGLFWPGLRRRIFCVANPTTKPTGLPGIMISL